MAELVKRPDGAQNTALTGIFEEPYEANRGMPTYSELHKRKRSCPGARGHRPDHGPADKPSDKPVYRSSYERGREPEREPEAEPESEPDYEPANEPAHDAEGSITAP